MPRSARKHWQECTQNADLSEGVVAQARTTGYRGSVRVNVVAAMPDMSDPGDGKVVGGRGS